MKPAPQDSPRRLSVFPKGSIQKDGTRTFVHPADVSGRFMRSRYITFAVLLVVYVALPWIQVGDAPAVFLDIEHRQFHLFGATFNAQDTWLLFFLLTAGAFALIFATTLLGRVWCGYACPQTVFLEGLYRRVERFIEGESRVRMRRNRGPWNLDKLWRKTLKHGIFVALSLFVAHVFISYFVSLPRLFDMVVSAPSEHPEAFVWMAGITGLTYFNFSWFREQLCLVVCPYGRLQSALLDDDTFLVVYDEQRGEPRGKANDKNAGACVDCGRCVAVCPTAIDIRNGTQLECIGCAACIDACDDIMAKLGRDPGLVRYDSLAGLQKKPRRILRPRILFYGLLGVIGLTVAIFAASGRKAFEANILRQRGAPFVLDGEQVRNALELHVVNKQGTADTFTIVPQGPDGTQFILPQSEIQLDSLQGTHLPLFAELATASFRPGLTIQVAITSSSGEQRIVEARLLGPAQGGGLP